MVAEVEDWEDLRLAGAGVKEAALRDLATHLETLEASLVRAGATVHWARDAEEACAIVARVAHAHGVDEVVKVKSMATMEIGLNEALEAEGIAAWETDLAELIVQLGDDLPSHILVPAIHRNRAEIREIFMRRMGDVGRPAPDDLTDEPVVLAAAARAHLREKFLRAKVAVSGANFAVADTGTLVVVESEGNGRMCLTLPDVLISVVGIEKVVATWSDLDPMLRLLPRSSTGERMNPYTSTWSGVHPGDGPQEVHVVLLDNGRTRALADDVGPPGAALHPLLGLPQRLPGLRAHRRPRLRLGLPRPDRRDPQPAAARGVRRADGVAAVRLLALRRVLRGLPGPHRHPVGAGRPAGRGRRLAPRRPRAQGRGGRDEGRRVGVLRRAPAGVGREGVRPRRPRPAALRPYDVARRSRRSGPAARARRRLDRRARPARAAGGVLPGVVGPHRRRPVGVVGRGPIMSARDDILRRVREALDGVSPAVAVPPAPRAPDRGDLVALFVERVEDYRAEVTRCSADELGAAVADVLDGRSSVVPPALGLEVAGSVVDDGLSAAELDAIDAVVTRARVGIAETGTIVLDHQPDQGRRAISLVPDLHVCIVDAAQVVADVPDAIDLLDPARPLTWISGPSATSDIELDRVEGVHGPRTLHVLLVD